MSDIFFVIGCPRSGTTAYAKILDTATNARVFVEQDPKLRIESRKYLDGTLHFTVEEVLLTKKFEIQENLKKNLKYGDKNPCYLPFIDKMNDVWDCKIVFLLRDGREVVRSLMNWHERTSSIYAMREDGEEFGPVNPEDDPWDYSRLRPKPEDPLSFQWKELSRFQKCCWYWANFNRIGMANLSRMDENKQIAVNVSRDVSSMSDLFKFLDLKGFNSQVVSEMLGARINSMQDRSGREGAFPHWKEWTVPQTQEFEKLAGPMMKQLGYW